MNDIYFEENYGKLYEDIENGKSEVFEYNSSIGKVFHLFIKREIPFSVNGKKYYDLVTPYGYGGPLIIECKEGYRVELVKNFEDEFQKYCNDNDIVSEFVRFHPIEGNAIDFKECYEINHIRNTVGTNLVDFNDPFQSEFSKSCRKNIRKALKEDISYKITKAPTDISEFKKIYYSTMNRNNADDYYYFNDDYFNRSVKLFRDNLLLVEAIYQGQTIAMGFYFIYGETIHIHLSGTLSEFLYLSPAYILRFAVTEWGKKNGYRLIHHGGGRTNDPKDSLFSFKKQFGKNTEFEFYIGKKIWNKYIYEKLCEINKVVEEDNYFPAYRSKNVKQESLV
ncbi:GNAT family N-acetyltransferase [Oceanobacillus halophilus]|uniref:Lipid II:glycine glycyltransferase n=1 Tax=Oceanobacillus halophilus TaxID=930130 RepID=A0A495A5A2_9BACI|nr:GNAT family N-acetyltransferase [Oceanobacillus halophilus]RKQ34283.1 GNAT family N-acetyltransferase [Oceanobacillus halophilus]